MSKVLLFFCLLTLSISLQARPLTLYAASSMTNAIEEIARQYEARYGQKVITSFAASSSLARQIAAGAPADLFISANTRWMQFLADKKAIQPNTNKPLLKNRLALIRSEYAKQPVSLATLADQLGDERLALANPDHVPAGIYARQALENSGQWPSLAPHLALGQNVRATLLLVERGEAPYGIVYNTDARQSTKLSQIELIPDTLHEPIVYPVALLLQPLPEAMQLYQFLFSSEASAIFNRYGFQPIKANPSHAE
ncbi:molybdate ABC transporter substrate-binding protein [Amphritea opalescens]|uniref:Molybdate ABC transporter substrate-binding protein n=1 Tax=Amphritea opalescens TaxID=2490544 RepID=A0A430KS79_9GAMM|nr:molybdate ABC transporter substrate-binding protein [Amphritea opalescens]RTE66371.1 molybdate ABC transporter substrate-binding protein [Amphritea opalescens]